MNKKPLTEVLAQLYIAERYALNPEATPWVNMSDEMRAVELGAMVEVIRTIGLLGWEVFENEKGLGVRRIQVEDKRKKRKAGLSREQTDELRKQTNPLLTQGEMGTPRNVPQFTGRPCDYCQSLNTIQNGKCLLCMDCKATGECG